MRTGIAVLVVAGALAACADPSRQEVAAGAQVMYDAEVETLAELRLTSEAVVVAEPLPDAETVLLDRDGIVVLGRPFRVVRAVKGPLAAGDQIVVTRVRYGTSPAAEARLNEQGLTASDPPDDATDQPPFDRPLYLLGLAYTGDDYPIRAWAPASGPHSRVALDSADVAAATAEVEVDGTPLHHRLDGRALPWILRRLDAP